MTSAEPGLGVLTAEDLSSQDPACFLSFQSRVP